MNGPFFIGWLFGKLIWASIIFAVAFFAFSQIKPEAPKLCVSSAAYSAASGESQTGINCD